MTFRDALTALSNLAVTGISSTFDVDAVPDELNRGQLPALLALPINLPDETGDAASSRRLLSEGAGGFEALAFAESARSVTYSVSHLLLVAPLSAGSGLRTHLPRLIDLIDAYFDALAADVTLGGALLRPARVHVEPGIYTHSGVDYVGCAFRHTWAIGL